jgi:hypothetical protein
MKDQNDLTGKKFGKYTVIKKADVVASHPSAWVCSGENGGIVIKSSASLIREDNKSNGHNNGGMFKKHRRSRKNRE